MCKKTKLNTTMRPGAKQCQEQLVGQHFVQKTAVFFNTIFPATRPSGFTNQEGPVAIGGGLRLTGGGWIYLRPASPGKSTVG